MNKIKTTENNPEKTTLTLHEIKELTDAFQLIIAKLGTYYMYYSGESSSVPAL
ncbi:MAG: hypothetical protein KAR45_21785 [Desulfobacteraceae bacterium]|nr:hypothetical protein [Desulfobacteraceae bacterium]